MKNNDKSIEQFQPTQINILNIDDYFKKLSTICQSKFNFYNYRKVKDYFSQLLNRLSGITGQSKIQTIYSFIKRNIQSQIIFEFSCQFEYYQPMDELSHIFFTTSQKGKIVQQYKILDSYRNDSLIINLASHLAIFMQQFSDEQIKLIDSPNYFRSKDLTSSQEAKHEIYRHKVFISTETDIFCNIFNQIYQPTRSCLSSSDVLQELQILTEYIKTNYQAQTINLLLCLLKVPQICNCDIKNVNLIISTSIEKIVILSGEKSQVADHNKRTHLIIQKVIIDLCSLRNWLIVELGDPVGYMDKSILNLLQLYIIARAAQSCDDEQFSSSQLEVEMDNEFLLTNQLAISQESHELNSSKNKTNLSSAQKVDKQQEKIEQVRISSVIQGQMIFANQEVQTDFIATVQTDFMSQTVEDNTNNGNINNDLVKMFQLLEQKLLNKIDFLNIQQQELLLKVETISNSLDVIKRQK